MECRCLSGMVALTALAVGYLFHVNHLQDALIVEHGNTIRSQGKALSFIEQRLTGLESEKGSYNLCKSAHKICSDKNQKLLTAAQNALNISHEYEQGWMECVNHLKACEKKNP